MTHAESSSVPLVSVVIPTRGRPELLRETIATIVAQDYEGPVEILVLHDREEPDPTLLELGREGRTIRSERNEGTPGLAGGRNHGVRSTTGEIIASCDDDDLWHVSKLRRQVERFEADPTLLAVGTGIRLLMGDRNVDWPGQSEIVSHERLLGNRVKELHSSTLAMRRIAFAKAGEYDEDLPYGYGEDYDWLLRVSRVGRVGVVTEVLADIRKDVPSWFRGRATNTAEALEYLLAKHQDWDDHPRGKSRVLGQIAFARANAGERRTALRYATRALRTHPASPHALLGLVGAVTGADPQRLLLMARRFGRGLA